MERPKRDDELEVDVDALAFGGLGVSRHDGFVIFSTDTVPGDRVRVRIRKSRRRFAEADLVEVLTPSPDRITPPCAYVPACGGCRLQHVEYAVTLRAKQQHIIDHLERIGHLEGIDVRTVDPAVAQFGYRNKMEYSAAPGPDGELRLGFHRRGRWDEVVNVDPCLLATAQGNAARDIVRAWAVAHDVAPYDQRAQVGMLRHVVVREGIATGELLVTVVTAPGADDVIEHLVAPMREGLGGLVGLLHAVNDGVAEVTQGDKLGGRLALLPLPVIVAGVAATQQRVLPEENISPFIRALVDRPDYLRQRLNQIDRILVPTRLMQNMLVRNGIHPTQLRYVPYGVKLNHIRRDTRKGTHPKLRIGFIGTFVEHKGAHILIQAFRNLGREVPAELKIFGNLAEFPDYADRLRAYAAGDTRITFPGNFPNDRIGDIFANLDALVVPSLWYENTPLVIYSAMAAGCPVIATNLGGMAEAVHDRVNGLLFERGSISDLATCLQTLCADRPLVQRLALATTVPTSIPQYADILETNYREIFMGRGLPLP